MKLRFAFSISICFIFLQYNYVCGEILDTVLNQSAKDTTVPKKLTKENMPGAQYYDGKKLNIPISHESGVELYEKWVHQGLSSLISSLANRKSNSMNEYYRTKLFKCSKSSETLYDQSQCVFKVIDEAGHRAHKKSRAERLKDLNAWTQPKVEIRTADSFFHPTKEMVDQAVQYRSKREIIRQNAYKLHSQYENMTPFGVVGKYLSKIVNRIKEKKPQSYNTVVKTLQDRQEKKEAKRKAREQLKKRFEYAKFGASHILNKVKLTKAEQELATELQMPDDIVDTMKMTNDIDSKQVMEAMNIMRGAIRLAAKVSGDNKTASLSDKKMRIASPRLLSVTPEDPEDQLSLLSPSLFSLHNNGKGIEALMSVPGLLKGLNNSDYQQWLNFIIEASGVTDALEVLKDEPEEGPFGLDYRNAPRGIDGQPMFMNKENITEIGGPVEAQKAEVIEKVQRMLVDHQTTQFKDDGYSVLTHEQLDVLYGPHSPYANPKALKLFKSMSKEEILTQMEANLRDLGRIQQDSHSRRKRALVLSPVSFTWIVNNLAEASQPFILSPAIFTVLVLSPAFLGPVILTPWLFVGVIISPRVMCPVVLSPVALSAVILSPLVMDPLILSPAALVPFVLAPNVLSPNILTPNVLVPSILSPFALCPQIMSPAAVTAIVLSPFVLSPSVYSPAYIATLFLAPHALSPLINSTGKGVSLILSPSALS